MKRTVKSFRPRHAAAVLLATLGLALGTAASAQWQWRDKNNQMHFTDVPPPSDIPDKDILKRPPSAKQLPASPPPAAAPASALDAASAPGSNKLEAEAEARRAKAEQEEKAKKKAADEANAAARADNCARAKRQMTALDSGMRISRVNDKGEKEFLDDKARADEAQHTRAVIASDCK